MDTIRKIGSDVLVVPLSNKWNQNFLPMDANGEKATPNQWYEGGDVLYQMERPHLASREIDGAPQPVKPRVLSPLDFMKGGGV